MRGESTTVLVVESDAAEADSMVGALGRHGYRASSVSTGSHALRSHRLASLVLLSLDLPDVDGLEVCRNLRALSDVPLIARTRDEDDLERVLALREGADDCVARSWSVREVDARIEAVLRRYRRAADGARDLITLDPLVLDARSHEVFVDDRLVDVTSKEFELLYALAANPGAVRSRKDLMAEVWGSEWGCTSRTIDTHVSSLRAKLGSARSIVTVRGVGYRIGQIGRVPTRLSS